ncbi:MAG: hypothetical protein ACKVQA_16365 [Burkholderiales bacterium]
MAMLCGCAGKGRLTAKAVGCNVMKVDIVPNEASRRGSTTDWCAKCKETLYRCVSNAAKDKVECRPAKQEDKCG